MQNDSTPSSPERGTPPRDGERMDAVLAEMDDGELDELAEVLLDLLLAGHRNGAPRTEAER